MICSQNCVVSWQIIGGTPLRGGVPVVTASELSNHGIAICVVRTQIVRVSWQITALPATSRNAGECLPRRTAVACEAIVRKSSTLEATAESPRVILEPTKPTRGIVEPTEPTNKTPKTSFPLIPPHNQFSRCQSENFFVFGSSLR